MAVGERVAETARNIGAEAAAHGRAIPAKLRLVSLVVPGEGAAAPVPKRSLKSNNNLPLAKADRQSDEQMPRKNAL
jgi:hypothetical protein